MSTAGLTRPVAGGYAKSDSDHHILWRRFSRLLLGSSGPNGGRGKRKVGLGDAVDPDAVCKTLRKDEQE
jgi:hypothetical protein